MSKDQRSAGRGRGRGQQQPQQPQQPQQQQSMPLGAWGRGRGSVPAQQGLTLAEAEERILPKKDQASLESQFTEKLKVSQPGGASAPAPKIVETPIKPPQAQTLGATAAAAPTQSTLTTEPEGAQSRTSPVPTSKIFDEQLVKKPAERGTLGRPIRLCTNHYRMKIPPMIVYQYDVSLIEKSDFNKEEARLKTIYKEMFGELMKKLPPKYKHRVIYNFSKNLFSLDKLPFEESNTYELTIEKRPYLAKITWINQLDLNFAKSINPEYISVLDLIMTQTLNFSCINVARSFFKSDADYRELGFDVQLWKGAYASVRPSECGLTWNIDSANSPFYVSKNLLELASYHYNCSYNDLKSAMERDRDGSSIGVSFLDEYMGRDIKTQTGNFRKKIKGLGPNASYMFEWKKPTGPVKISIQNYLKQQYNIDLKYPNLPCVNVGRESFLPMELCSTEPKNKKKLTPQETADMIKFTAVAAPDRLESIQNWTNTCGVRSDPVLREYNISLDPNLLQVEGRVLDPPDIEYGNQRVVSSRDIGNRGGWDHRSNNFSSTVQVGNWVIINTAFRVKDDALGNFINALVKVSRIHGISMGQPKDVKYYTPRGQVKDQIAFADIRKIFEEFSNKYKPLGLVVAIFPGSTNWYKIFKTCGDVFYGIPTQGVEDRNVNRVNDQTISNILLKINSKLGGINFKLFPKNQLFCKYLQHLYQGPMMIFGADVTHPAPGENSESIAAVTGSLDKECCFYGGRLYAQKAPKGQSYEMIHDLDKMFISLLRQNYEKNKIYPKRIVFFRDGVSEGQFNLVLRYEMNKIRNACATIAPGYKPGITFVVVQKRHHTRFLPFDSRERSGKSQNVPPGTVVDKTVVTPFLYDFFLCSHFGIQGTSRPCRYFVLHDDNEFTMNQMELLSYYLCHVYSRCPKSVSFPAPAYYAHLAAFRGREYIRQTPHTSASPNTVNSYEIEIHDNIKNKMFFT